MRFSYGAVWAVWLLSALALGPRSGWAARSHGSEASALEPVAIAAAGFEVRSEVLCSGRGMVRLVATGAAQEPHEVWVHGEVLAEVEYFKAEASFQEAASAQEPPERTSRVVLPESCGLGGLVALLLRLYAGRRWSVRAWAEVGAEEAAEAADLADMWLLHDIVKEARHASRFLFAVGSVPGVAAARSPSAAAALLGRPGLHAIATDDLNGSYEVWVHQGVLEDVECLKPDHLQDDQQHGVTLFHLHNGCSQVGLLALLRRLYGRRRWPASSWRQRGLMAATEAAKLAREWHLRDIALEAAAAASFNISGLSLSEGALDTDSIRDMVCGVVSCKSTCDAKLDVLEELFEQQAQLGVPVIDGLSAAMGRPCMKMHQDSMHGSYLTTAPGFKRICQMVGRHAALHAPTQVDAAVLAVRRLSEELRNTHYVYFDPRSRGASHKTIIECLEDIVDQASRSLALGDVSDTWYAALVSGLLEMREDGRRLVSHWHIADLPETEQAALVDKGVLVLDTPERLLALRGTALHAAARSLLPQLNNVLANAFISALSHDALPARTLQDVACSFLANGFHDSQQGELVQQLFLEQAEINNTALDGLLAALGGGCTPSSPARGYSVLCGLAGRLCADHFPERLGAAVSAVDGTSLGDGAVSDCLAHLLGTALQLSRTGALAPEAMDDMVEGIRHAAAVPDAVLAAVGDEAQAAVVSAVAGRRHDAQATSLSTGAGKAVIPWLTTSRCSILRRPAVVVLAGSLLPSLGELDDVAGRAFATAMTRHRVGALPSATLMEMACSVVAAHPPKHMDLVQQVFSEQSTLGLDALDGLIAALQNDCMLRHSQSLVSEASYAALCRLAGGLCATHAPGHLSAAVRSVDSVEARLSQGVPSSHAPRDLIAMKFAMASRQQRVDSVGARLSQGVPSSRGVMKECLAHLLSLALDLASSGALAPTALDCMSTRLQSVSGVPGEVLAALGAQAQAAVARTAVREGDVGWFTVARVSALRGPAAATMAGWLLPRLGEVDVEVARAAVAGFMAFSKSAATRSDARPSFGAPAGDAGAERTSSFAPATGTSNFTFAAGGSGSVVFGASSGSGTFTFGATPRSTP